MKIHMRNVLLGILLLLVLVFAGLNWSSFSEPTTLSLLVTTIVAPIGLMMLGVVVFLTLFYAVVMAHFHTTLMLETGRAAKELEKVRALADRAEESRFQELREYLEAELMEIRRLQDQQIQQAEAAAVDLAETVLGETAGLERRLQNVESDRRESED